MSDTLTPPPMKQLAVRYDGLAKVTGKAKYAAEFTEPFQKHEMVYAWVVQSTIPTGTIASMDQHAAERAAGVVHVLTPFNAPQFAPAHPPNNHAILQNKDVHYNGQPIAVVLADTLDHARYAASLLKIRYTAGTAKLDFAAGVAASASQKPKGEQRGDVEAGLARSSVVVDETYITPVQNHNPMEPHATIAWWEGDQLNIYNSTQDIFGDRQTIARTLNIPLESIRVRCLYTGGGFGCKGTAWSHVILAAMAAKIVQRPVKLALDRTQLFGPVGARPSTVNHIKLGADANGKILAIEHHATNNSSMTGSFTERSSGVSTMLYASESNFATQQQVHLNWGDGTYMRAPGEATGTAVLEIAMDELAEKLRLDPVQLRLINYAETDPRNDHPFSSKHLRECYAQAGERFGWSKRPSKPGTVTEGNDLIGYGMATATYPAYRNACQAMVRVYPNGHASVSCGSQDIGTGTYTIMAQAAAAGLGLDPLLVEVKLGDTLLPKAPGSGGSQSAASYGPAIEDAAMLAKNKLIQMAMNDKRSPLYKDGATELDAKNIETENGKLFLKSDRAKSESFAELLARNGNKPVEGFSATVPHEDRHSISAQSFGAVFAEVAVDKDTHMPRVRRIVATYDIGTLLNKETGGNQLTGGLVWGTGFALHEETLIDPVYGRTVNENLGEYHVPVNADIGEIDVTVLDIPDYQFNPMGARGIGEIGITGGMAAIANAIYNATGKRVRHYPITPDKIMTA